MEDNLLNWKKMPKLMACLNQEEGMYRDIYYICLDIANYRKIHLYMS